MVFSEFTFYFWKYKTSANDDSRNRVCFWTLLLFFAKPFHFIKLKHEVKTKIVLKAIKGNVKQVAQKDDWAIYFPLLHNDIK